MSAVNAQQSSRASGHVATDSGNMQGGVGGARPETLEYLADLVLELKDIADRLGCATLSGMLAVAHKEALIQSRSV